MAVVQTQSSGGNRTILTSPPTDPTAPSVGSLSLSTLADLVVIFRLRDCRL